MYFKLAKSKSHNKEVKEFAQRMVTDHTGVNKQATALVTKLKVTPEDSDTSKALKDGGVANVAKLKGAQAWGTTIERSQSTVFSWQGNNTRA